MNDIDSTIQDHRNNGRRILGCFHLYPPVELIHSIGFAPVCPLAAERHLPSRTSQRPRPADLGLVGGKVCDVRDLYLSIVTNSFKMDFKHIAILYDVNLIQRGCPSSTAGQYCP